MSLSILQALKALAIVSPYHLNSLIYLNYIISQKNSWNLCRIGTHVLLHLQLQNPVHKITGENKITSNLKKPNSKLKQAPLAEHNH